MDDKDILQMLEEYEKEKLEIGSNYNIKKAELEKEYKKQQINIKYKLLNFLSQKEEEAKNKLKCIRQLRNALFENDDDEGMKELNDLSKDSKATFENVINSQEIQLREGIGINGMKKININEEKEKKDEN